MYHIRGAFAEYEREIIRERTKAGLRRARREGKKLGRPRVNGAKVEKVLRLRKDGLSLNKISELVGISKGAVFRIIQGGQKSPPENPGVSPIENDHGHKTDDLGPDPSRGDDQ